MNEFTLKHNEINKYYLILRRLFEILLILALSPILISLSFLISIFIIIDSKGPILYPQLRAGKNGKLIIIYKFRSMKANADDSYLTKKDDNRITAVGKIIRKYKLDELPQIYNVLSGDMGLIGPRPVPANHLEKYINEIKDYNLRHVIRPGISGLAQVRQGYTTTVEEERYKLKYDLFYINNISIKLDFFILLASFKLIKRNNNY